MSIPCSEDQEVIVLSSDSLIDQNNTEAFEFSIPMSTSYPPATLPTAVTCTSITAPTNIHENLSSPIQETHSEESYIQPVENSVQPLSFSTMSNAFVVTPALSSVATGLSSPPAPVLSCIYEPQQNTSPIIQHSQICEEVGFDEDSSSSDLEPVQETLSFL